MLKRAILEKGDLQERLRSSVTKPADKAIDPVGGRYPIRQLLLQPEVAGAYWPLMVQNEASEAEGPVRLDQRALLLMSKSNA
jgi:hypothetical protein